MKILKNNKKTKPITKSSLKELPKKVTPKPVEDITEGQVKTSKKYKTIQSSLSEMKDIGQWLCTLPDLLLTPKYLVAKAKSFDKKTNKPKRFIWKKQHDANLEFVFVNEAGQGEHADCANLKVRKQLSDLRAELIKTKQPLVVKTDEGPLVITVEQRRTGDKPKVNTWFLVIRLAIEKTFERQDIKEAKALEDIKQYILDTGLKPNTVVVDDSYRTSLPMIDVAQGPTLTSVYGSGATKDEALIDLARKLSGKPIVINSTDVSGVRRSTTAPKFF
jgi:hypothetical protein